MVLESTLKRDRQLLEAKYTVTSLVYDILDYPWERQYRRWRPGLLRDVDGLVLEAGVGTGRNLPLYRRDVNLLGIDLCRAMIRRAVRRGINAVCKFELRQEDATLMQTVPSDHFDWIISMFLCCVLPDALQSLAVSQFERVLKVGGRFRLLEMVYSSDPKIRRRQDFFAPLVEKLYGARFDRNTLDHLKKSQKLKVSHTYFLKKDTYLVIEGYRSR